MPTSLSSATRVPSPSASQPYRGVELVTRDGRSLPLVWARLHAEAKGGIARVVLEQRFESSYDETLHVTYRMPLPADGAVSGYAFELGGRTVTGRVDRKQSARDQFERAIAAGKTAALLEQDRDDIFTQSIGNLPARDGLTAKITVDLKLTWLAEGEWELRFPTVIGPRYVGTADSPADAMATAVETATAGVAARLRLSLRIGDERTGAINSPSHALRTSGDDVELRDLAGAALDRDLVVRWPVARAGVGLSLDVARPAGQDDMYGLLTIVPPSRAAKLRPLARDLIVLLDTSGSMGGGPLAKATQVIAQVIESLGEHDRLEMIEFSSRANRYKPAPVAATSAEKREALAWLARQQAGGGTEMRSAVIEAMKSLRPGAQRQVLLATDGYIGGEEQVVRELQRTLPRSCRLHFLGVGSSVNRTLSTAMARAGRGAEVLCGLDEDAERAAKRLGDRTRMPVLTNVELSGSAVVARAPALLPDVFEGAPFVAAVQVQAGELCVRGDTADGVWEHKLRIGACRPGEGAQAMVQLFGRELVADLETRAFAGELVDAEVEAAGLAYQIATRLTSWVAIDQVVRKVGETRDEVMPQALPYGTTAASFGLRAAGDAGEALMELAPPPPGAAGGPWMDGMQPSMRSRAPGMSRSAPRGGPAVVRPPAPSPVAGNAPKQADAKSGTAAEMVMDPALLRRYGIGTGPSAKEESLAEAHSGAMSSPPAPAKPAELGVPAKRARAARWKLALVVAIMIAVLAMLWWLR